MFPALMPWPMTLAPTNEAVRLENCAKKNLDEGKKITVTIWEVMKDVRIVLLSKKHKVFVRVGERLLELMVMSYIFCLIYRLSSVNGCTLWILSRSVLVLH
jgi:hypothetical protein